MFSAVADGDWCIYKISGESVDTIAGCYPAAYYDRYDCPPMPGGPLSTSPAGITAARPLSGLRRVIELMRVGGHLAEEQPGDLRPERVDVRIT